MNFLFLLLLLLALTREMNAQSCPTCSPSPNITCAFGEPYCSNGQWVCGSGIGCSLPAPSPCYPGAYEFCSASGWYCYASPIIIDTGGEGFHFTSNADGVSFVVYPGMSAFQTAWTDAKYRNGFLVLDRNGNGKIDDATELFGDLTEQPAIAQRNGFNALAVFDQSDHGGNGNGRIDRGDQIYSSLRVWIDTNHNGVSEKNELFTLHELGIAAISLRYSETATIDENGIQYRFRARIFDEVGSKARWTYDVFFPLKKL